MVESLSLQLAWLKIFLSFWSIERVDGFCHTKDLLGPKNPTPAIQQDNESAIMPPKTMRAVVLKGDYKVWTAHAAVLQIYVPPKVPAMF
jgi:hypothetical protein